MTNPKHESFVQHYLVLGSAPEAAALAGYSPQYGSQLLKKAHIQELIEAQMEGDPDIAGREERLRYLSGVMRGVDVYTEDDSERGIMGYARDLSIEPKDRLKACEMLSKIAGDFRDEGGEGSTTNNVILMLPPEQREEGRRRAGGGRKSDGIIELEATG